MKLTGGEQHLATAIRGRNKKFMIHFYG